MHRQGHGVDGEVAASEVLLDPGVELALVLDADAFPAIGFGQLGCTLTTLYGLDYLHAHKLQGLVIILTTIVFWFAFHALDYIAKSI